MALYRKRVLQELIPWTEDLIMSAVSISEADRLNGSPKKGDMIAINTKDLTDMWLVAGGFFGEVADLIDLSESMHGYAFSGEAGRKLLTDFNITRKEK